MRSDWIGLGLHWIGLDWIGLDLAWIGLVWIGFGLDLDLDRIGLDKLKIENRVMEIPGGPKSTIPVP